MRAMSHPCPLKANPSLHLAGSDSDHSLSFLSVSYYLCLCVPIGPLAFAFQFRSVITTSLWLSLCLTMPVSCAIFFLLISVFLASLDIVLSLGPQLLVPNSVSASLSFFLCVCMRLVYARVHVCVHMCTQRPEVFDPLELGLHTA